LIVLSIPLTGLSAGFFYACNARAKPAVTIVTAFADQLDEEINQ
jgi:hypothetical protein